MPNNEMQDDIQSSAASAETPADETIGKNDDVGEMELGVQEPTQTCGAPDYSYLWSGT